MDQLYSALRNSRFIQLTLDYKDFFLIPFIMIVFYFLFQPLQVPLNISFIINITTSINHYHNLLSFFVFNDLDYSLEIIYEAPGYFWIQSAVQYFLGNSMLAILLFWTIFSIISLYYGLKILPFVWDLHNEQHEYGLSFILLSLLLVPFILKFFLFDFFLLFIFLNTPFIYYNFKGIQEFFNYNYDDGKKFIFKSFTFLFVYFIIFGQKSLFVIFISNLFFILHYYKKFHKDTSFFRWNAIFKLQIIQIVEICFLLILFMAFFDQHIEFFIIGSFIIYFISLYLIDNIIISDLKDINVSNLELKKESKKLLRTLQMMYLPIIICLNLLLGWFFVLSHLIATPFTYQLSLESLITFFTSLMQASFLLVCLLFIFLIIGVWKLIVSKEYYTLSFYFGIELIGLAYIIIGPTSLLSTILTIFIGLFFISVEGVFYSIHLTKIFVELQNRFIKYFFGFFFTLSLFIGLIILNLDRIFFENDVDIFLIILLFTLLIGFLTVIFTYIFVKSFIDFLMVFFLSLYITIMLFSFSFVISQSLTLIFIFLLSIIILLPYKLRFKTNPRLILLLLIIILSSYSFNSTIIHNDNTLEDTATIMKNNGVTNSSYWILPDQSIRLLMKYYLNDFFPINYGNYGYYPFTTNSSQNLDMYINANPNVRFFLVNLDFLLQEQLFSSISWLQMHCMEYKVHLEDNEAIQNHYILFIKK